MKSINMVKRRERSQAGSQAVTPPRRATPPRPGRSPARPRGSRRYWGYFSASRATEGAPRRVPAPGPDPAAAPTTGGTSLPRAVEDVPVQREADRHQVRPPVRVGRREPERASLTDVSREVRMRHVDSLPDREGRALGREQVEREAIRAHIARASTCAGRLHSAPGLSRSVLDPQARQIARAPAGLAPVRRHSHGRGGHRCRVGREEARDLVVEEGEAGPAEPERARPVEGGPRRCPPRAGPHGSPASRARRAQARGGRNGRRCTPSRRPGPGPGTGRRSARESRPSAPARGPLPPSGRRPGGHRRPRARSGGGRAGCPRSGRSRTGRDERRRPSARRAPPRGSSAAGSAAWSRGGRSPPRRPRRPAPPAVPPPGAGTRRPRRSPRPATPQPPRGRPGCLLGGSER